MPYNVKVSGTWRTTTANYIKVSGTWRTVSQMWIKVAGTWRQFFTSVRSFSVISTNYPDNKGAVGFGVYSSGVGVRFGGESPVSNLCYSSDLVNSPSTWTARTNYPVATQGPFGDIMSGTIWGIAGYPSLTGVYGTSNSGASWTTGASCSSAYWHQSAYSSSLNAIFKAGGFSSVSESFNGTSWTSRTSRGSLGFGSLVSVGNKIYYFGGPGSESNSTSTSSYDTSSDSWTVETSQPVATRRTCGTNLDGKIIELDGINLSSSYVYSGTGGTWSVGSSGNPGGNTSSATIPGVAAYLSSGTAVWRYA